MENIFLKITPSNKYSNTCENDYSDYFQFHILSFSKIVSAYYKKNVVDFDIVQSNTLKMKDKIKSKSSSVDYIQLYEKDGIYLLTDSKEFINFIELFEFNVEQGCYEYISDYDLFDYLGDQDVDIFFKKALTTVGAKELIPLVETSLTKLRKDQIEVLEMIENTRIENAASPKYIIEIIKIEKNYIPRKIKEFKCASPDSVYILPEIKMCIAGDERMVAIVKEIATGKIIDGTIEEFIERIKFDKWSKKNPTLIDLDIMMRMELDNDDPNFISYDDYVSNGVEYEEGDDEYEPRFDY